MPTKNSKKKTEQAEDIQKEDILIVAQRLNIDRFHLAGIIAEEGIKLPAKTSDKELLDLYKKYFEGGS